MRNFVGGLTLAATLSCATRGPATVVLAEPGPYTRPVYPGLFYHSWEGGGVFVPCSELTTRSWSDSRAWQRLHSDGIMWPTGARPDRRREGAATFLLLTDVGPLPPDAPGADTARAPLRARVIAMRRAMPHDCGR